MKKYFLLAAMVGVALTGCVSNEPDLSGGGEKEITFSTPVVGASTKAVVFGEIGTTYPTTEKFVVYAVWHEAFNDATSNWKNGSLYMDGVEVEYNSTTGDGDTPAEGATAGNGAWKPATTADQYYWPKNGSLSFAAYSPAGIAGTGTSEPTITYGENGLSITGFTVPSTCAAQYDLLFSERTFNKTSSTGGSNETYDGVDLTFQHALSSIQFKAKKLGDYSGTTISITKIELSGIYSKGDFAENVQDGATYAYQTNKVPAWSNQASQATYTAFDGTTTAQVVTTTLTRVANSTTSGTATKYTDAILLPQTLATASSDGTSTTEGAKVTITYTINPPGNSTDAITQTYEVSLNDGTNDAITKEWKPGMRYTYIISIGLDEIYFAPAVEPWDDDLDGDNTTNGDDDIEVPQV